MNSTAAWILLIVSGLVDVAWTGISAVGTVAIGMAVFNEPAGMTRIFWIAVTLIGIIGLKITSH